MASADAARQRNQETLTLMFLMVLLVTSVVPLRLVGAASSSHNPHEATKLERFVVPPSLSASQQHQRRQDASTLYPFRHLFENKINVPLYSPDDYLLLRRLGFGKFSEVFEAIHQRSNNNIVFASSQLNEEDLVVVKCLKAISQRKIRREVEMLMQIQELPNMTKLLGVVVLPTSSTSSSVDEGLLLQQPVMPALILKHAGRDSGWFSHSNPSLSQRPSPSNKEGQDNVVHSDPNDSTTSLSWPPLSEREIKYYLLHLLIALDALHSRGIMHRDVKPRNVLLSRIRRKLVLIDFGLAERYSRGEPFNVRVASRHYKAPELLLGYEKYDCAIDMWGVGCILASLLFHREPFFRGRDNLDQLGKIATILGTDDLMDFCQSLGLLPLQPPIASILNHYEERYQRRYETSIRRKRSWSELAGDDKNKLLSADACHLLDGLLQYDFRKRWTARQAMGSAFFDQVRQDVWRDVVAQQEEERNKR